MKANTNQKLVELVLRNIPFNVKPVSFLMESLDLSRESAYRRIRGEIPFSIEEIAQLSYLLKFSIDEVLIGMRKDRAFFDFIPETSDSCSAFLLMLQKSYNRIDTIIKYGDSETLCAFNRILPICTVFQDQIFKFTYYKWVHQNKKVSSNQDFSDFTIPQELIEWQKKLQIVIKKFNNATLIFDPNIFLNLIKDIVYYHQRALINNADLAILKEELLLLIELYENIARTGVFGPDAYTYLYLSPLCVNANIGYATYAHTCESLFWIFTVNPIFIYNPEIFAIQKKWLNSLKRQSTLISQSNEILQTEFFNTQRGYLDDYLKVI
jgi:hypothetical protein